MNLKEFSRKIGLSTTTISRALGGYPEVSKATRERVAQAAKELGYQPNFRAQSLATGRSKTIGFVISTRSGYEFFSPIFGDFIAAAASFYADYGYDTLITLADDENYEDAFRELKASGKVDGLIVQAPKRNDQRIDTLCKLEIPFVVHGRSSAHGAYPFVDVNNHHAFKNATKLLLDLGHRRIALLNGNEEMDFAYRRRKGYEEALANCEINTDPDIMTNGQMTEIFGYQETLKFLELNKKPTAILASSLILAKGARQAIEDLGLKAGQDISIIAHDDILSYLPNGAQTPFFTSTRSSVREAGQLCASILLEQIESGINLNRHHILEAELILGQSTALVKETR